MDSKKFYESYHKNRKLPKRIIDDKNFTYRTVLRVLNKYCKSGNILDIGSGVGTIDFYLAQKGMKITGVEISKNAVDIANKSARLFNLDKKITYKCMDFSKFKSNIKYNFVICTDVLEHLPNDEDIIRKISKMTVKNGFLMLTFPSQNAPLMKFGLTKYFDETSGHLRSYSIERTKNILAKNNFKIVHTQKAHGIITHVLFVFRMDQIIRVANRFGFVSDILISMDNFMLKLFGESGLIFIAKKL